MDKIKESTENEISWQAPEHDFFTKGPVWFFFSIFIAALLFLFSLWQGNFLFAVFIVIAALILSFTANNEPPVFNFRLEKDNIFINDKPYPLSQFQSFSLSEEARNLNILELQRDKNFSFHLKIPFKSSDIEKIRSFLHNYLDEIEHHESFTETISHLIGF